MKIALISAQQQLSGSNGIEDMLLQRTLLGGGCCQKFVNKCIEVYISISPLKIIKTTIATLDSLFRYKDMLNLSATPAL